MDHSRGEFLNAGGGSAGQQWTHSQSGVMRSTSTKMVTPGSDHPDMLIRPPTDSLLAEIDFDPFPRATMVSEVGSGLKSDYQGQPVVDVNSSSDPICQVSRGTDLWEGHRSPPRPTGLQQRYTASAGPGIPVCRSL